MQPVAHCGPTASSFAEDANRRHKRLLVAIGLPTNSDTTNFRTSGSSIRLSGARVYYGMCLQALHVRAKVRNWHLADIDADAGHVRFRGQSGRIGLNGGPAFQHNEAFSFQIATDDQQETDRYWNAIVGNGGQESQCGWCKDKWGISWQITPRVLTEALAAGGDEAKRAFDAMMGMKKIDVATIEAARRGAS